MANVNKPNGFRFVKTLDGSPVAAMLRSAVPSTDDIFIGSAIKIASGVATEAATGDQIAGVMVGLGTVDGEGNLQAYDPADLGKNWFDTSADVEADYRIIYVPAENALFEVQADASADLLVGGLWDFAVGAGSAVTGRSATVLDDNVTTNDDLQIIEIPRGGAYDATAGEAYKRYWVKFVTPGIT